MRQEIDLATLGPIQTLMTLDPAPPPGDVFDFAKLSAGQDMMAKSFSHHAAAHPRVDSLRSSYWQGPSLSGGPA